MEFEFQHSNAVKYVAHAGKKSKKTHIEYLQKAIFYLQDELKQVKGEGQRGK